MVRFELQKHKSEISEFVWSFCPGTFVKYFPSLRINQCLILENTGPDSHAVTLIKLNYTDWSYSDLIPPGIQGQATMNDKVLGTCSISCKLVNILSEDGKFKQSMRFFWNEGEGPLTRALATHTLVLCLIQGMYLSQFKLVHSGCRQGFIVSFFIRHLSCWCLGAKCSILPPSF